MANLLFINHIQPNMTLDDLDSMFKKDGLNVNNISSYGSDQRAIATCPDQAVADRLIDKYNGRIFHGMRLVVEPWIDLTAPVSRSKGTSVDSIEVSVNAMYHNTRSKTSIHPADYTEFSTSRTREFVMDRNHTDS
ncbi:hypothetical protein WDU94_011450 [Cyamophila willieti]